MAAGHFTTVLLNHKIALPSCKADLLNP